MLNSRGRYLLPLAKDITGQVSSIESIMSERNDTLEGKVEIVASTTLGNYILPYLIGAFKRIHPKVHINLLVYGTKYAERLVFEKKMDLGFVEGPLSNREEILVRPWFEDELVVLCAPNDPLAHNENFDLKKDLKGKKWVMRERGSGTDVIVRKKLGSYMDDFHIVMEMGHPEPIKRAVESGAGITCLSALCICREVENGWLKSLKIEGLDMKRQLNIIQRKDFEMSDSHAEFLAFCDVMTICDEAGICLSSPWKLQSLLARHSAMKK